MKIENYSVELRQIRRATILVMLLNVVLVAMIAAGLYVTFTQFGQTTLTQGVQDFYAWLGRVR